jgi:DNA polymerase
VALAVGDAPPELWIPGSGASCPEIVKRVVSDEWPIHAFNANFELNIWHHKLTPRYGWPEPKLSQWRCTMATALALSLPARLENVARALELRHQKDTIGRRLMLLLARPRKAHKDEDPNRVHWFTDVARLERLYEYCQQDVETERELFARLQPLSPAGQALWELDAIINQRGFCIDRALAEAARKIAQAAAPEINDELAEATDGSVVGVNQIAKLQIWLRDNGCTVKDLQQKTVTSLLEDPELPPKARRVLELRQDGGQAAVKKINALLQRAGDDDRVRGALQFHKASTGRWAGEGFQPQNLKRPQVEDLEAAIAAVKTGDYEHVRGLYPRVLALLGDLGRSFIVAKPGHRLIGADFSAIESRVLAWVAGEQWKLDAYARFDVTQDPRDEPYCILACRMLHVPDGSFTAESPERLVGKVADLSCGFVGGASAIEKFAPGMFDAVKREQIKAEWRAAHPNIKRFWYDLDRAAWTCCTGPRPHCPLWARRIPRHGHLLILEAAERPQARVSPRPHQTDRSATRGCVVYRQFCRPLAGLSCRPRRMAGPVDGKYRASDRARSTGRSHAAA